MLPFSDVGNSLRFWVFTISLQSIFGRSCIFEVLFPTHDAVLPGISERRNQPTVLLAEDAEVPELDPPNS